MVLNIGDPHNHNGACASQLQIMTFVKCITNTINPILHPVLQQSLSECCGC